MSVPSQKQLLYQEQRRVAAVDVAFLELVASGMTREDLAANIGRRPAVWQRYASWLTKLPSAGQSGEGK